MLAALRGGPFNRCTIPVQLGRSAGHLKVTVGRAGRVRGGFEPLVMALDSGSLERGAVPILERPSRFCLHGGSLAGRLAWLTATGAERGDQGDHEEDTAGHRSDALSE